MNKLLEGYEHRIKEFIYKMAQKPIVLKNNNEKYMTSRQALYSLSANKILDKKGFVFKSYKSDQERINEINKNKKILEKFLSYNNTKKQNKEFKEKLKRIQFIQPSMHFKKRSGLEVIYDIFKKKHYLNEEQKKLYNQLIKMGLIHSNYIKEKNEDDENGNINSSNNIFDIQNINYDIINSYSMSDEEKYKKILHDKILNERKNMIIKRKLLLNVGNRINNLNQEKLNKLQNEEIQKTYFKATENIKIFKSSTVDNKLFKAWSSEDFTNQKNLKKSKKIFYKTISTNFPRLNKKGKKNSINLKKKIKKELLNDIKLNEINNNNNLFSKNNKAQTTNSNNYNNKGLTYKRRKSALNLVDEEKTLKNLEIKKEIISVNPLLFKLHLKNESNNEDNRDAFSLDKLNSLKKIAFENEEYYNETSNSQEEFDSYYEDYKMDENIVIDGKSFRKADIDKIAEKVLNKCNYNHKKNNYKNMSGKGKLMFTNGLTVNEFGMKYGIIP